MHAEEIISLYQQNNSVPEIAKDHHLSLDYIYRLLKKHNIPRRNRSLQNKIRFEKKPLSFQFHEPLVRQEEDLFIAGLMLYMGEGAKTGNTVDFANSDPRLLKIFILFLRKICGVEEGKMRFYLYCFSDQNSDSLKAFWSKELKVDSNQFTKPYIKESAPVKAPKKTRIMPYGVLHIRYNDKRLLEKMLSLCSTLIARLTIQHG